MNPISLALTAIRVITTLRPSTPVDEPAPAPKRGKKAAPVVVKKNYKPLIRAAAIIVMIGAGYYAGQMDSSAALAMLTSIDLNGIMALFQ